MSTVIRRSRIQVLGCGWSPEMRSRSPDPTQSWAQTISCNLPSLDTLRLPPPANLQNTRLKMLQQLLCKFPRDSPPLLFVQQNALFCSYFVPGSDDAALCCVELTAYYFLAIKIPSLLFLEIYIIGSPQTMRALIVMIPSQKLDQRPINETKNSVKIFKFLLNNTIYFRVLPHFTIFTARDGRH